MTPTSAAGLKQAKLYSLPQKRSQTLLQRAGGQFPGGLFRDGFKKSSQEDTKSQSKSSIKAARWNRKLDERRWAPIALSCAHSRFYRHYNTLG